MRQLAAEYGGSGCSRQEHVAALRGPERCMVAGSDREGLVRPCVRHVRPSFASLTLIERLWGVWQAAVFLHHQYGPCQGSCRHAWRVCKGLAGLNLGGACCLP
jgi:hypothetical protein